MATAGIALGGLALAARLMERRGAAARNDRPTAPAETPAAPAGAPAGPADAPAGPAGTPAGPAGTPAGRGEEPPAPPASKRATSFVVAGTRIELERIWLPALTVAASLVAAFLLRDALWSGTTIFQTLVIAALMMFCVGLWCSEAPDRRSPPSVLIVVATVAMLLYLFRRLQELLLPDFTEGDLLYLGVVVVGLAFGRLSKLSRQPTPVRALVALVVYAGLLYVGVAVRDQQGFQVPNALIIVVLAILLAGLFLWWHEREAPGSRSELGAALLGGVVVAFAVLAFQMALEQNREASAERRSLRIAIGMASDLRGVDLAGRDLSGFYLRGKTLKNANLTDANLSGADLREADLSGATLSGTDLSETKLSGTKLPRADLTGTILTSADLTGADLTRATLARADLSGAVLARANLAHAYLTGANLADANVSKADLTEALADDATIFPDAVNASKWNIHILQPGADLRKADLSGADLTDQNLSKVKLAGANLSNVKLSGADLSGADLSLARFEDAVFSGAKLQHANLTGTTVGDADLTGALADAATRWPKGANPHSLGVYVLAPGSDLRKAQLSELDLSGADLSGANLAEADLSFAVLSGADLSGARLDQADLSSAKLDGTDLFGADLADAVLTGALGSQSTGWPQGFDPKAADAYVLGPGADLRNADLTVADLSGFNLAGAKLSGASLFKARLFGTDLTGADLSNADLTSSVADPATTWPDGFDYQNRGAYVLEPGADLTDADLSYSDLSGANLSGADLSRADLTGTNLTKINFSGAQFTEANLSEADLNDATLTDADLTGVQADTTTIWPRGFNPMDQGVQFSD